MAYYRNLFFIAAGFIIALSYLIAVKPPSNFNCRFIQTNLCMKYYTLPVLTCLFIVSAKAADKDSTVYYHLPDSVKAVQFMAEVNVQSYNEKKYCSAGIKTDAVSLTLRNYKGRRGIYFYADASLNNIRRGLNTGFNIASFDMIFSYDWVINETYKLLISQATDSAGNFSLYSGYIFLPRENKWKLIGTAKIENRWNTIQQPAFFYINGRKQDISITTGQVWCQRQNGSWRNMKNENLPPPTINLFGHNDSVQQHQTDIKLIEAAIKSGKLDAMDNAQGVYYKMIKDGTGKQVSITDTVTVLYKLTLLNDGSLVTETKAKPDTFSLKRLIRGWQIGVPLCKVGGKIKLVIPSDLGYSIRTRAAKIPPNSILVFEIEVIDAKQPQ